jgi:hypothetical protein
VDLAVFTAVDRACDYRSPFLSILSEEDRCQTEGESDVVHFPMRRTRVRLSVFPLLVAATLTAAACTQEPLKLNTVQLGRGLNLDRTVSGFTTRFKPTDTIYAAVLTDGAGSGKVKVRWLYAGRLVSEPDREVTYQGPASTEFHMQNTNGFPPGEYSVELFLDGKAVGSRSFRVETDDPRTRYTFPNTTPKR